MPQKRSLELDGLRGCAVLLVTIWHSVMLVAPDHGAWSYAIWRFSIFGQSGVDLFFVLSGYLIVGILYDTKHSQNYFTTFYARRAFRILPPFLILVLPFLILSSLLNRGHYLGQQIPAWSILTFTQNWMTIKLHGDDPASISALWSLAIEEQFYAVVPLIVFLIPRSKQLRFFVFVGIASAIARAIWFIFDHSNPYTPYVATPLRLDGLCVGAAIALLQRSNLWERLETQYRNLIWRVFYVLCALAPAYAWTLRLPYPSGHMFLYCVGHFYLSLLYGTAILLAVFPGESRLKIVLRHTYLRFFGLISYSLYLFHTPIKGIVFFAWGRTSERLSTLVDIAPMTLSALIAIGFSYALAKYVEKTFIAIGKSYTYGNDELAKTAEIQSPRAAT